MKVGRYKSILEDRGIESFIKDDNLSITTTPDTTLCILQAEDIENALKILKDQIKLEKANPEAEEEEVDIICPKCGKSNPANFETCWSCSSNLLPDQTH